MPHVNVKMYPGRSAAQKAALADALARTLAETLGDGPEAVSVVIEDIPPSQWMETVYRPEIERAGDRLFKRPGYGPLARRENG